jgi:sterol desaturase/sphingolipid hydroxylase (fatty acid hydroxylase superfamily)
MMSLKMRNFFYYTDFIVFPVVLLGLITGAHRFGIDSHKLVGGGMVILGIIFWTFLEYGIHRFILHNGLIFSDAHNAHHANPKALIGTPTWLTVLIMVSGVYVPAVYFLHPAPGLAFSFGVTFGYLVYSFAHYSLHHWNVHNDDLFYSWKRIHALHHFGGNDANFGVTSSLWDHLLGTAAKKRSALAGN